MNELALCAGVGAMSLGIGLAVGRRHRVVGCIERDAFAASILMARMEDKALDPAPIWDDLSTFDGRPFRDKVDLVSSGLPCQPYSVAGKMRGHEDERALWPHFVRVVGECEPALIFIENVPAFRKHFEPVWRALRGLGFEWAPPLLQTASESGAPHIRERFFALAAHPERIALWDEPWWSGRPHRPGQAGPRHADLEHPDSRDSGLEGRSLPRCGRADECAAWPMGDAPAVSDGRGLEGEWCGWVFDGVRQTLWHDPDRCSSGCRIRGTFWDSESPPVRVASRAPGWVDELRAIGNVGAPPVAYASAFLTLAGGLLGEP